MITCCKISSLIDRDCGWVRRKAIHLAISADSNEMKRAAIIETARKGEFSYPTMIQSDEGLMNLTFTWNRQRIKHAVIDPAKLHVGAVL